MLRPSHWLACFASALAACGGAGGGAPSDASGGDGAVAMDSTYAADSLFDAPDALDGSASSETSPGGIVTYGPTHTGGQFDLGPIDWDETTFHNACAPATKYAPAVRAAEGYILAAVWNGIPQVESLCDACILVRTAKGRQALLRVVSYGATTTNSIDVSYQGFGLLDTGESSRDMTWQLAECEDTGNVIYEFEAGASASNTTVWVRNARAPLAKVEVHSPTHPAYVPLRRSADGSFSDAAGFGTGAFDIRLTALDGRQIVDSFAWPSGGIDAAMLTGAGNFR